MGRIFTGKIQPAGGDLGGRTYKGTPASDDILTICSYYATLKADKSYRKRVCWLVMHPNVAVYEYQRTPPSKNAAHGLARKTRVEFVRSKPAVLERIRC